MLAFFRSLRYLPQYRRIAAVLTRHGLGWLADQLGLSRIWQWPRRLLRRDPLPQPLATLAQRLCRALEELGPSFVLLGRYLGTRVDLFPPRLCRELRNLPAGGPAVPIEDVVRLLEEDFGQPLDRLWTSLAPVPWRCAWLEQMHEARTPDGHSVWVLVPNRAIQDQLAQDASLFEDIARQVDVHQPLGWRGSATRLWQDWRETLRQQSSVSERRSYLARWQGNFAERDAVVLPAIDDDRTSAHVLTCEAWPGRAPPELATEGAEVLASTARSLYRFVSQAIFRDGFYPAPGALDGLLLLPDGRLVLTLWAPVGQLDADTRLALWQLLAHFQGEDLMRMLDVCAASELLGQDELSAASCQAVRHLVERYQGLPLAELRLSDLAADLFALANRSALALPEEINLLLRTLLEVEELGCRLDPHVVAAEEIAPAVQEAMAGPNSWLMRGERLARSAQAWMGALQSFPVEAMRLLSQALRGNLTVGLEPRGWQRPMHRLERMVTRLVVSMVTAGLLLGLSFLVTALLPMPWTAWGWLLAGGALATLTALSLLLIASFLRREG
jgi:ubiquinone biosynthesis protein